MSSYNMMDPSTSDTELLGSSPEKGPPLGFKYGRHLFLSQQTILQMAKTSFFRQSDAKIHEECIESKLNNTQGGRK